MSAGTLLRVPTLVRRAAINRKLVLSVAYGLELQPLGRSAQSFCNGSKLQFTNALRFQKLKQPPYVDHVGSRQVFVHIYDAPIQSAREPQSRPVALKSPDGSVNSDLTFPREVQGRLAEASSGIRTSKCRHELGLRLAELTEDAGVQIHCSSLPRPASDIHPARKLMMSANRP